MPGEKSDVSLGGAAGGEDEFDFETAGDQLSEDLFGGKGASEEAVEAVATSAGTEEPPAQATTETTTETSTTTESTTTPPTTAQTAPRTWRAEAAAKWGDIPAEVQQEILKREEDIFRGLEEYKGDASIGKSVKSVVSPFLPLLQQHGIDPVQHIGTLMNAHAVLATGTAENKLAMFKKLAEDYGISESISFSDSAPFVDPAVADLHSRLNSLQSSLTSREAREAAQVRESIQQEINTFAAKPENIYFNEVANDIATLLKSGAAKNLPEAYEKAVWLNPITRAKEQSRLTAEATAKQAKEAALKVEKARTATGANVTSRAKAASGTAPLGSIDDTLTEALAAINART